MNKMSSRPTFYFSKEGEPVITRCDSELVSPIVFHANCPLCQVSHHTRFPSIITTPLYYEDEEIIILECRSCHCPMAIFKSHEAKVADDVKERILKRFVDLFGTDSGDLCERQRSIKGHYHVHWRGG